MSASIVRSRLPFRKKKVFGLRMPSTFLKIATEAMSKKAALPRFRFQKALLLNLFAPSGRLHQSYRQYK
jgi:hypothetical protein